MTPSHKRTDYFSLLPANLELFILNQLDFESLLTARATCYDWNQIISKDMLPFRANLQIQIDPSKQSKLFKHGQWKRNIMGSWEEISLKYPTHMKRFKDHYFHWGRNSGFLLFEEVRRVTLYEGGNGSFLDFIHTIMASMPCIDYVHIRESLWTKETLRYGTAVTGPFWGVHTFSRSWRQGMKNLSNIKTFRICLQERNAYMVFLKAVESARPTLVSLELDLSKMSGFPLLPVELDAIYLIISRLIITSKTTLENLRIKWNHRVEGNAALTEYSLDLDPYVSFLVMVSNNLEDFKTLKLKVLLLNFPIISFFSSVVYDVLVPFLLALEGTLERFCLSRIKYQYGLSMFHSKFGTNLQKRFEYGVYMVDSEFWGVCQSSLNKAIRSKEFHSFRTVQLTPDSIHHPRARRMMTTEPQLCRWKRHPLGSLKVYNSSFNSSFEIINLKDILYCFGHLQELELIDDGIYSNWGYRFSNAEFNSIFIKLRRLKSLKITNLQKLTDAGLTLMSKMNVEKMKDAGVLYEKPDVRIIPMAQARFLKYLELRNLSSNVSDISVYFAIQYIPKLEKISFHGRHMITEWGERVLIKKFHKNPLFAVYFQKFNSARRTWMTDFP